MKRILYLLIFISILSFACKPKQNIVKTDDKTTVAKGAFIGKVSHKFKSSGCATVIILFKTGSEKPLILIPFGKLDDSFDKDGMEIYFDYHPLKVKNPEGCAEGMPAEITNISKK